MIARAIPVMPVKPDLKDSVRMAVAEIERFLAMFHGAAAIRQTQASEAIAGQWLSRLKGFHDDDDFLHLVRDFLSYLSSGGERSRVSDQLAYYFSGFLPSYGTACIFVDMVADGQTWPEVRAFMHRQAYGNARAHVETFDWVGGEKKAKAEVAAWTAILKTQDVKLRAASGGAILLAQAQPAPDTPITDFPANDPFFPRPQPQLRLVPPMEVPPVAGSAAAEGAAVAEGGLSEWLAGIGGPVLLAVVLALQPTSLNDGEDEALRKMRAEYERRKQLPIPDVQSQTDAQTDTTNNACKAQIERNQKNGAVCENDGYELMEKALVYTRLVDPPKGRGLDGLFEKQMPFNEPNPMPVSIETPKPGKLVFIPTDRKPPRPEYAYGKPGATATYPRFVVFEAKHISKSFEPDDTEGIKKEVKRRLGETCDGTQVSVPWTERRIPHALSRESSGRTIEEINKKAEDIRADRYARWIFACSPGPLGTARSSRLYVFIDVVEAGMNLEKKPADPASAKPGSGNGY
jgi:hypothetical protein